jgi:antitoxin MazE
MRIVIKKWGNSAAVRIPAPVLQATQLEIGEDVGIREEFGQVVIEPVRDKKYKLDDLLKGITRHNLHEAIDFGGADGKEAW